MSDSKGLGKGGAVSHRTIPSYNLETHITLDDMKKVMRMVGISTFTNEGYFDLVKEAEFFLKKMLVTAWTYMSHQTDELRVEHVLDALKFHNLKFYGLGTMCKIGNSHYHQTELLTTRNAIFSTYDSDEEQTSVVEKSKKANLVQNFKNCDWYEEESYYGSEGEDEVVSDDDCSTTSSNLNIKHDPYFYHESSKEKVEGLTQELTDAQVAVDELAGECDDEEKPLGETDDEDDDEWSIVDNVYHLEASSTSFTAPRFFSRKQVLQMYEMMGKKLNSYYPISPAALAILHQVFEDHVYTQYTYIDSPLVLKHKMQQLQEEVKMLKTKVQEHENGNGKRTNESLQTHFDIAARGVKRRVSP